MASGTDTLLGPGDGPVLSCVNPSGAGPFLLIGDHAGNAIPQSLGDLGLAAEDRARHIAWDLGVEALGRALAPLLDAPFVAQRMSRLVIDCNRDPVRPDAMPEVSDGTRVPGNIGLSADARAARVAAIHAPYQQAIADRIAARGETVLVALHSFTPAMGGVARPWHAGVLHNGANDRFARAVLAKLQAEGDLVVGDNEPYAMDRIDYTIPRHAFAAGLPYVELEIRQDLLPADPEGWAIRLARVLTAAL